MALSPTFSFLRTTTQVIDHITHLFPSFGMTQDSVIFFERVSILRRHRNVQDLALTVLKELFVLLGLVFGKASLYHLTIFQALKLLCLGLETQRISTAGPGLG